MMPATSAGQHADQSLALLLDTCSQLGRDLDPFLPGLAGRIRAACDGDGPGGRLPMPQSVFPRIGQPPEHAAGKSLPGRRTGAS